MKIDEKDKEILNELQKNATQTYKVLAETIDIPLSTLHMRISKMEKEGVIKGYTALLDFEKLDRPATLYTLVKISAETLEKKNLSYREVAQKVADHPLVQAAYLVAGEWDVMLKIKGPSLEANLSAIVSEIRRIDGVATTSSFTCFGELKDTPIIQL